MDSARTIIRSFQAAAMLLAALLVASCGDDKEFGIRDEEEGISYSYPGNRLQYKETRRVLLFYECGFNSLYSYLSDNMDEDLVKGYLPGKGRNEDVVLVYSKIARNSNYADVPSYLRRLYADKDGSIVSDTLMTYSSSTVATSPGTMTDVLNYVKTTFPAKGYGMVFSSHGSGWLPAGYYNNPSSFERSHQAGGLKAARALRLYGVPEGNMETDDPYAGFVRSLGQDRMSGGDVEMSVPEFVSGFPFHLDYLLFDMCFGGGMEVVYALKDVADYIGVSPAEVLAAGMYDYTTLTSYLLKSSTPDLAGLFKASFDRYDSMSGDYRSATVTLVRSDGIDRLAEVCKGLFAKYSDAIANAPVSRIQGYFRLNRHYFYDLEDTFAKCGASDADLATLKSAIDGSIVYKNATPSFIGAFDIKTYSGYSIYLPCAGTALLDSYYKDEPWNRVVELVK